MAGSSCQMQVGVARPALGPSVGCSWAMKLMIEGGFQEEREAAGKWVRAQLTSAQLSTYFVGYQEHVEMRRAVEEDWGEDFTYRRYHDTALSFGSPPVKYVRALILDEPIPHRRN